MPEGIGYAKAGKLSASGKKKISDAEKIRRARKIAGRVLNNRSPKEKAEDIRRRKNLEAKKVRDKARASKKKTPFRSESTKRVVRGLIKSGLTRAEAEKKLDKGAR